MAALTIILYSEFLLISLFLGFSNGAAPILSYNYGAKLQENIKRVIRYAFEMVSIGALLIFLIAELGAPLICRAFEDPGTHVYALANEGMRFFSIAYLFMGFNVFISSIFTSFNNGKIAAVISFGRSFFFVFIWLLILTHFWEMTGLWLAIPFAELTTVLISTLFYKKYRKVYQY